MIRMETLILHRLLAVLAVMMGPAMADTSKLLDPADFTLGLQDGNQCSPVKDSVDLVECINSVRDRGKVTTKNPSAYEAGIYLTQWRLQDAIFCALQKLPATPRLNGALKVSHDMTVASFVGAQRALRKIGLSDAEGLNTAGVDNGVLSDRWSYWNTQPVPSWITPEK